MRRGPETELKWGILKYFFAEISFEKSKIIQDHQTRVSVILGQKKWGMTPIIRK